MKQETKLLCEKDHRLSKYPDRIYELSAVCAVYAWQHSCSISGFREPGTGSDYERILQAGSGERDNSEYHWKADKDRNYGIVSRYQPKDRRTGSEQSSEE